MDQRYNLNFLENDPKKIVHHERLHRGTMPLGSQTSLCENREWIVLLIPIRRPRCQRILVLKDEEKISTIGVNFDVQRRRHWNRIVLIFGTSTWVKVS